MGGGQEKEGGDETRREGGEEKQLSVVSPKLKPDDSGNVSANRSSAGLDLLASIASGVPAAPVDGKLADASLSQEGELGGSGLSLAETMKAALVAATGTATSAGEEKEEAPVPVIADGRDGDEVRLIVCSDNSIVWALNMRELGERGRNPC